MAPGEYTVTWGSLDCYDTPEAETSSLQEAGTLDFVGVYVGHGTIEIQPQDKPGMPLADASWTVTGPAGTEVGIGPATLDGMESGSYSISWGGLDCYLAPGPDEGNLSPCGGVTFEGVYTAVGELVVSSTPTGATVYLDGNYGYPGRRVDVTDVSITIEPRYTTVAVRETGYSLGVAIAEVQQCEMTEVHFDLVAGTSSMLGAGTVLADVGPGQAHVFVADWNMDGVKDLVIGHNGEILLVENMGAGYAVISSLMSVPSVNPAPFVADWDNDGLQDLLVGLDSGDVALYSNTGAGFDGPDLVVGATGPSARPAVVDWNNDDRKDLLVGDGTGEVWLYMNVGTDAAPVLDSPLILLAGVGTLAPMVAYDWNYDGAKDLVIGDVAGNVHLSLNEGTDDVPVLGAPTLVDAAGAPIAVAGAAAPFAMDWNEDGLMDLLVGADTGEVILYFGEVCPSPSAPQSLAARSQTDGIRLGWNRVEEPRVTGYNIYRSTLQGPFELIGWSDLPIYIDYDVVIGQSYTYYVTATTECGGQSTPSNTVTESPGGRTR